MPTSYWDVIVPIVAAWVGNRYGNPQGDTPNQYPMVLPPEMKRIADEAWEVYKRGGSPVQQDIRALAIQSAAQTPSEPTGFQFVSQELRNQPFAGGIKAPKYDVSKLKSVVGGEPVVGTPPPGGPMRQPTGGFDASGHRPRLQLEPPSGGDGPAWGDTIADSFITHPGMSPRDRGNRQIGDNIFVGDRYGAPPAGGKYSEVDFGKVNDAWTKYKTEHPDWAKLGAKVAGAAIGAMTGLPGLIIGPILSRLILRERPPTPGLPNGAIPGYIPPGGTPGNIVRP